MPPNKDPMTEPTMAPVILDCGNEENEEEVLSFVLDCVEDVVIVVEGLGDGELDDGAGDEGTDGKDVIQVLSIIITNIK